MTPGSTTTITLTHAQARRTSVLYSGGVTGYRLDGVDYVPAGACRTCRTPGICQGMRGHLTHAHPGRVLEPMQKEQPAMTLEDQEPSRAIGAQVLTRVAAAALQYASGQVLPVEGLNMALAVGESSPHDVSLYCWDWPAEDLVRWADQYAPQMEPYEGTNFLGRRGVVQVADVRLRVAVIVHKQEREKETHDA
jgi:hypothetical protein